MPRVHDVVAQNGLPSCYIRPIVFRGAGVMGINPLDAPVDVAIAAWPWGAYLGDKAKEHGVRAKVTSWRRISADSLIPHSKASGQYLNSVLAKIESQKAGYEEGILLDQHGFVSEGTGENIYVVRDGIVYTPPQTAGILDGINRKSVIQIAADEGFELVERDIARAEMYLADEVFMTGTAAELTPIREIDDHVDRRRQARPGDDAAAARLRGRPLRARSALRRLERRRARGEPQGGGVAMLLPLVRRANYGGGRLALTRALAAARIRLFRTRGLRSP